MDEMPISFIGACKQFFGMKPDQTLSDFRDEIKHLTDKDRAEIAEYLKQNGYKLKAE